MRNHWQSRTELLLGTEALKKLFGAHVFVAGLGGVGAYTAEMLCRAGIGNLTIADKDKLEPSNRNRQLVALRSREGMLKTEVMRERLLDINPELNLITINEILLDIKIEEVLKTGFDYVADAIDTIKPKVKLITLCLQKGYPIVSSMGSGGRTDPMQVRIADISDSYNCRLAYHIRKEIHKAGFRKGFKVIFSPEDVLKTSVIANSNEKKKKSIVGTISYMPPLFGCLMASVIIRDLIAGSQ